MLIILVQGANVHTLRQVEIQEFYFIVFVILSPNLLSRVRWKMIESKLIFFVS